MTVTYRSYAGADGTGEAKVLRWSAHPRCVGLARNELRKTLDEWDLSDIEDSAVIVLSELFTDTVLHAHSSPGREIETRYLFVERGLRIEVHDSQDEVRQLTADSSELVRGCRLMLVDAMADRWGMNEQVVPRRSAWAELVFPSQGGA